MQDFKSYTLDKRPARGQLAVSPSKNTHPDDAVPTPNTPERQDDKIILPLNLPDNGDQSNAILPVPSVDSMNILPEVQAAESIAPDKPVPAEPTPEPHNDATKPAQEIAYKIKSGDSLASIFKHQGLSANLLHRIVHSSDTAKKLTDIRPGEMLYLALDDESNLMSLRLVHNKVSSLEITPNGDSFDASLNNREVEIRSNHLSGTIENSLYVAAKKAGLSEKLIMQLADIFGWDVDFALEIRSGDRFTVLFQEDYLDGEKLKDGPILAAEFVNQGKTYRAIRYIDETGHADYYTPEGRSMRKAFLRAPGDFR
ncbi:MAG: LysM-like peptidoglycan-binding domain-containing protein [Candidatus Thiodiazotropha sp.]